MRLQLRVWSLFITVCLVGSIHAQTAAYVANSGGGTVSVIDVSTNTVVATIPVSGYPLSIVGAPDGARVYVASDNGLVSVIDTSTNNVVGYIGIPSGLFIFQMAITPDGRFLYVPTDAGVIVFSTASLGPVRLIPAAALALAFNSNGTLAFASGFGNVPVIATGNGTVLGAVPVATGNFQVPQQSIATHPRYAAVFVTGGLGNPLTVIATTTFSVLATFPMGQETGAVAIAPDASRLFVTSLSDDAVYRMALPSLAVDPVPISAVDPFAIAITPDSAFVYVTSITTNSVSVFSAATKSAVATIPVGDYPIAIAMVRLNAPFTILRPKHLKVNNNKVSVDGDLTLGANGAFDFISQGVSVTIGDVSVYIPGFVIQNAGAGHYIAHVETSGGLKVDFDLNAQPGSTTSYTFNIQIKNVTATVPNPATVTVAIGHNTGTMTVPY